MPQSSAKLCPRCVAVVAGPRCPRCGSEPVRLAVAPPVSLTGRVLDGRFEVGDELGRGGMGVVYRGRQAALGRDVAIKVIARGGGADLVWHKRFMREARVMSRLQHPNNIQLYDVGYTDDGDLYMVMELLEGRDLAAELAARGLLSLPRALAIGRQVLAALVEAHALGVVHRDLKPGNIYLARIGGREHTKVMDFGLAKLHSDPGLSKITRTGTVMGTPAYMAPEQARAGSVDARSDLYSVGVIFFEMLTGRLPFIASGTVRMLVAHMTRAPPNITSILPKLPAVEGIDAFVQTLLAKKPADRPTGAARALEILGALEAAVAAVTDPSTDATEELNVLGPEALETIDPARPVVVELELRLEGLPESRRPGVGIALAAPAPRSEEPGFHKVRPLVCKGHRWLGAMEFPAAAVDALVYRLRLSGASGAAWRMRARLRGTRGAYLFDHRGRVQRDRAQITGRRPTRKLKN